MAKTFTLKILTPEKVVVSEEVQKVFTKATSGSIEFLYGHEPMIISSASCITSFVDLNGKEKKIFTSKGIINVQRDAVTFCLDASEFPEDIDFERAKKAKERALNKIKEGSFENRDIINASIERAEIRMKLKNNK